MPSKRLERGELLEHRDGTSQAVRSFKHWLDKGWRVAEGGEHPLDVLTGLRLGETTILVLLGPKNRFGARYFHIFLCDQG